MDNQLKTNRSIKTTDKFWDEIAKWGKKQRPPLNNTQVIEKAVYQIMDEDK